MAYLSSQITHSIPTPGILNRQTLVCSSFLLKVLLGPHLIFITMSVPNFVVVDFFLEEVVDYVPLTWVKGDKSAWPTSGGKNLTLAQNKLQIKDGLGTPQGSYVYVVNASLIV